MTSEETFRRHHNAVETMIVDCTQLCSIASDNCDIFPLVKKMLTLAKKTANSFPNRSISQTLFESVHLASNKSSISLADLPRFSLYDGEPRLCMLLFDVNNLNVGCNKRGRYALNCDSCTEYDSTAILERPDVYIDSDPPFWLRGRNVPSQNLGETVSIVERSMFQYPVRVNVGDSHIFFDNIVPIRSKVYTYKGVSICLSTKFDSCEWPQSTYILAALGDNVTLKDDWNAFSQGHVKKISVADGEFLQAVDDHRLSKGDWERILDKMVVLDPRFSKSQHLSLIKQVPTHPFDELTLCDDNEIDKQGYAALYLLARVTAIANTDDSFQNLRLSALMQKLCSGDIIPLLESCSKGDSFEWIRKRLKHMSMTEKTIRKRRETLKTQLALAQSTKLPDKEMQSYRKTVSEMEATFKKLQHDVPNTNLGKTVREMLKDIELLRSQIEDAMSDMRHMQSRMTMFVHDKLPGLRSAANEYLDVTKDGENVLCNICATDLVKECAEKFGSLISADVSMDIAIRTVLHVAASMNDRDLPAADCFQNARTKS